MGFNEKRQSFIYQIRIILYAIFVAIFFWILEAFIHYGIFFHSDFIKELISPGTHELWMRFIVVLLLVVFGIIAQIIINRRTSMAYSLAISEERYRILFDKAPAAITLIDSQGYIVDCNDATEKLTGFLRKEIIGKLFSELLTLKPDDLPQLQEKFKNLVLGQDVAPYELEIIRKDGTTRWIETVNSLVAFDVKVLGIQVIATDITEQKKIEIILREEEQRFRELTDLLPEGIYEIDLKGKFVFVNQRALELSGYARDDLTRGLYAEQMFVPEDRKRVQKNISRILSGIDIGPQEYTALKKDGGTYHVLIHSSAIERNGEKVGLRGIIVDMTRIKKAESQLRESEALLRAAMDNLPFDFFVIDKTGYYILQNSVCKKRWGDIIGKRPRDIADSKETLALWEDNNRRVLTGETISGEISFVFKGEQLHYYNVVTPISDEKGIHGILCVNIDISERKRAEEQLRVLSLVAAESPGTVAIMDKNGTVLYGNKHFAAIYNISLEEVVGKNWTELVSMRQDLLDKVQSISKIVMEQKSIWSGELCDVNADGETIWRDASIVPILDDKGEILNLIYLANDITERKKTEEQLKILSLVAAESPGSVAILDKDGIIQYVNKNVLDVYGFEAEHVVGKDWSVFLSQHSDLRKEIEKIRDTVIDKKQVWFGEVSDITAEGRTIWRSARIVPILDKTGTIINFLYLSDDITTHKEAELAVRQSEYRFRQFFENEPAYCYMVSSTGNIIDVNQAAINVLGYTKEEIIGKSLDFIYAPDYHTHLKKLFRHWHEKGSLKNEEMVILTKTGERRDVLLSANAVRNDEGQIVHSISVQRDITSAKRLEKQLKQSAQEWTKSFDAIGDSVCLLDAEGKILRCNKAMRTLSGKNFNEIIGTSCCEAIHQRQQPKENCPLMKMKEKLERITEITQKDHECWLSTTADPILDEQGKLVGIVLIVADITDQKRIEEELLKARKLESLGILAGGIAHDFNNILSSIMGNIEISKVYADPGSELSKRLIKADHALVRAKELVQQLLTFSKGGVPIKKVVSLADVIKESATFTLRGTNVKCRFNISDDLLPVEADEGQVSQVINNLVLNAQQSMPGGGSIVIQAENVSISKKDVFPLTPGDYVKVITKDEGQGIPEENISKIFDPYFTTKDGGSGLGLATTYSIIKKHGGHITVNSKVDEGTTFSFYLAASKESPSDKTEQKMDMHMGQGRILIMDDEIEILDIASEMLIQCGYEVMTAHEGKEALNIFRNAKKTGDPFDIIIVDLTVPGGMGGKELVQMILALDNTAKVIVSSGYSTDPILAQYKDYGFIAAIAKPYTINELSKVIAQAMKAV